MSDEFTRVIVDVGAFLRRHREAGPERILQVSGLERWVAARVVRLPEEALSAAERTFVRRLRRSFSDWDHLDGPGRVVRLRRVLEAIDRGPREGEAPARPGLPILADEPASSPHVGALRGVGPVVGAALDAAGIHTIADLLHTLPRDWRDRRSATTVRELEDGVEAVVIGEVRGIRKGRRRGQLDVLIHDGTGSLVLRWFRAPAWIPTKATIGATVVATGRATGRGDTLLLVHPELDLVGEGEGHRGGVVPIYPSVPGVGARTLRTLIRRALDALVASPDLPPELLLELGLLPREEALRRLHLPDDPAELPALRNGTHPAHRALLGRDVLSLQLALAHRWSGRTRTGALHRPGGWRTRVMAALPFALSDGQRDVLAELDRDLASGRTMRRLVLGDVGSGKTVLALLLALSVLEAGRRVAVLAPTEILARQWEGRAQDVLGPLGVAVELVLGGVPVAERRRQRERLAAPAGSLLVGTHALVQEGVEIGGLDLVIVDEQQRFGVGERARLVAKGAEPHLLALTATPIPRTLALALYGDLDLSILPDRDGRPGITTRVLGPTEPLWELVREDVADDGRVLVVLPRIDGVPDGPGVVDLAEQLANGPLSTVPLAVVHGGMPGEAKDRAVLALRTGQVRVLVGTTVLEVGIDVVDATLVVILEAERFGLLQLHQIRGRVGRGERPGRCLLVHGTPDPPARLAVLLAARDGFEVAEADLRLRGPGDLVGPQQAGTPAFRLMATPGYGELLERCRSAARRIVDDPAWLEDPDWAPLRAEAERRLGQAQVADTA